MGAVLTCSAPTWSAPQPTSGSFRSRSAVARSFTSRSAVTSSCGVVAAVFTAACPLRPIVPPVTVRSTWSAKYGWNGRISRPRTSKRRLAATGGSVEVPAIWMRPVLLTPRRRSTPSRAPGAVDRLVTCSAIGSMVSVAAGVTAWSSKRAPHFSRSKRATPTVQVGAGAGLAAVAVGLVAGAALDAEGAATTSVDRSTVPWASRAARRRASCVTISATVTVCASRSSAAPWTPSAANRKKSSRAPRRRSARSARSTCASLIRTWGPLFSCSNR